MDNFENEQHFLGVLLCTRWLCNTAKRWTRFKILKNFIYIVDVPRQAEESLAQNSGGWILEKIKIFD